MLNYPETQEKLHQEISQVLGTRFYFINTASLENYFDAVSLIMKAILLLCWSTFVLWCHTYNFAQTNIFTRNQHAVPL